MLHARMSALSEGHLAAVIFGVLGDSLVFCWEDFSFFYSFFPFFTPFSFFADFWSIGQGNPSFGGWSYIRPGLILGLTLVESSLRRRTVVNNTTLV